LRFHKKLNNKQKVSFKERQKLNQQQMPPKKDKLSKDKQSKVKPLKEKLWEKTSKPSKMLTEELNSSLLN